MSTNAAKEGARRHGANAKHEPWLYWAALVDEGARTALYPYSMLRNIMHPDECRVAVLDETLQLEEEFGRPAIEPLYELLWSLNGIADVCTTHTVVAPPDSPSPFAWATAYVGVAVIAMPRAQEQRHLLSAAQGMSGELIRQLKSNSVAEKNRNRTGWQVSVGPVNVTCAYDERYVMPDGSLVESGEAHSEPGFGHQIIVSGSAGTRVRAAERWSSAVSFVRDTLRAIQSRVGSASPFDHGAPDRRHAPDGLGS